MPVDFGLALHTLEHHHCPSFEHGGGGNKEGGIGDAFCWTLASWANFYFFLFFIFLGKEGGFYCGLSRSANMHIQFEKFAQKICSSPTSGAILAK